MTYNGNIERSINDRIIVINGLFVCPYCSESFRALAYHTRQVHNISAKELRRRFKLPINYPLQTQDLIEIRREQALINKMDIQLRKAGIKTRFRKGNFNESMRESISEGHKIKQRKIMIMS